MYRLKRHAAMMTIGATDVKWSDQPLTLGAVQNFVHHQQTRRPSVL
jgi:hypothetical protein